MKDDYKISCRLLPSGGMPEEQKEQLKTRGLAPNAGELVTITIHKIGKNRSVRQNAYWFAVLNKYVLPKFQNTNWDDYKLHCALMQLLGYMEAMILPDGSIVALRDESKKFDTAQWEEFMTKARCFLAEKYDIQVPLPNEDLLYKQFFPD